MAGGVSTARRAKTAIVRSAVPRAYRDAAAAVQLYGKAKDAEARGFPQTAERMKSKAVDWAKGNRVEGGPGGNFSGLNSTRGAAHGAMREGATWPPTQMTEDVTAAVARNAAGARAIAVNSSMMSKIAAQVAEIAPKVMTGLEIGGRLAGPFALGATAVSVGTGAIGEGIDAYNKGGSAGDVLKSAAWGGVNAATLDQAKAIAYDIQQTGSIARGLEKWAGDVGTATLKAFGYGQLKSSKRADPTARPGQPTQPGKMSNADRFDRANAQYSQNMRRQAAEKPAPVNGVNGNGKRGFQVPANQQAAQAAMGHVYSGGDF